MAPEVDIAALQRLRSVVDQLRDNLRKTERDLSEKNSNIDDVSCSADASKHFDYKFSTYF